ncbi:MAG: 5-carboxymethyl-2-hydroxymuconate isomerase [Pseudomonadota bacterium]
MPHLTLEYSGNIEDAADLPGLLAALRDAMVATGAFPLGGVRVRAFRADHWVIADGAGAADGFVAMALRMGEGRDAATRARAREAVYAAAEAWLTPRVPGPFALSLELHEILAEASEKRWNTVHARVAGEP